MKRLTHRSLVALPVLSALGVMATSPASASTCDYRHDVATGADTSASDSGWGGGNSPGDIVDGKVRYFDTWAHGLAFTGGDPGYGGESCGWRQVTLDFGELETFDRALIWHHGDHHLPSFELLEYWDGASWNTISGTSSTRFDLRSDASTWGATPTVHEFSEVTGSKVRYWMFNCGMANGHGWIYEVDVLSCHPLL